MDANKMQKTMLEDAAKLLDGVTTYADLKGITPAEQEALYQIGHSCYTTGRYAEAKKVFRFLAMIHHTSAKYLTALGSAQQALGEYQDAVKTYAAAAFFDLHKPRAHYYAAECFLALGDFDSTISGCRTLLEYCPAGTPENDKFRPKAETLLKKAEMMRKGN